MLSISPAPRALGTVLGFVGAAASSVLAGHVTRHVGCQLEAGKDPVQAVTAPFWSEPVNVVEASMDGIVGCFMFQASTEVCTAAHAPTHILATTQKQVSHSWVAGGDAFLLTPTNPHKPCPDAS